MFFFTIIFFWISVLVPVYLTSKQEYVDPNINNSSNSSQGKFGLGTAGSPFANKWDITTEIDWFRAQDDIAIINSTTILYGVNDWFGVQTTIPFFLEHTISGSTSRGISDIAFQGTFNLFKDNIHLFQLTAGVQMPAGSIRKIPATGTGSFDFVGEFYFAHDSQYWYADAAVDWDITSRRHNQRTGSFYSYFLTGGQKIKYSKNAPSTFYLLVAMTGFFFERDEQNRIVDPDSGGNVIFIGPYFSWLRKNILVEATFQVPFSQSLNGDQTKFDFYGLVSFEIQF